MDKPTPRVLQRKAKPLAVLVVGSSGLLVRANVAAAELLGCTADSLVHTRYLDLFAGEDSAAVESALAAAASGQMVSMEAVLHRSTGTAADVTLCFMPVSSQLEGAVQVTATPLIDLESGLVEGAPMPIFIKDSNGRYVKVNATLANQLGLSPEQIEGKTDFDLFPAEIAAQFGENDRHILATGRYQSVEEQVQLPEGERTHFVVKFPMLDQAGVPVAVGGISTDITDRKIVERKLAESQQRYGSLFVHNSDPVYSFSLDGRLIDMNPAMERLTGYGQPDLAGFGYMRLVSEGDRRRVLAEGKKVTEGSTVTYEVTIRHKEGYPLFWSVTSLPMMVDGKVAGVYCVAKDLTDRKWTEDTLRFLAEAGAVLQSTLEVPAMMQKVAELAVTHLVSLCLVFLVGGESVPECVGSAASDSDQEDLLNRLCAEIMPGGALADSFQGAVASGVPVSAGTASTPRCLIAPMVSRNRTLGALIFAANENRRRYGATDTNLVMTLTGRAALAVDNARLYERTRYEALHDALTGLPNREHFLRRLQAALTADADQTAALFFLDLDRFKVINDSLGHTAGDQLLVQSAGRLRSSVGAGGTVARFGGDEFTVLFEGSPSPDEVTRAAGRILAAFEAPFRLGDQDVFVTTSIGIVMQNGTRDPGEFLRMADIAMYQAKREGKRRFAVFSPAMDVAGAGLRLENELRRALQQREFALHYQPVVDLTSGRIRAMEALIRWQHPVRGIVSPAEFIPLAEETGLILPLGDWILTEACQQAVAWRRELGGLPFRVSVNLSARQVHEPALVETVRGIVRDTGIDPACLQLEITESVLICDDDRIRATLHKLKQQEISLAIDDFGTGYSSLHYLKRLPTDTLKVDRSFVSGLGSNHKDTALVEAVIGLARSLNLALVAEGIETTDQAAQLRAMGCPSGQGYLISRPLPAVEATRFLSQRIQVAR